jgi:hypothetical protein
VAGADDLPSIYRNNSGTIREKTNLSISPYRLNSIKIDGESGRLRAVDGHKANHLQKALESYPRAEVTTNSVKFFLTSAGPEVIARAGAGFRACRRQSHRRKCGRSRGEGNFFITAQKHARPRSLKSSQVPLVRAGLNANKVSYGLCRSLRPQALIVV